MVKLLFEYGDRLEFNKDRIIVSLIVALFVSLLGGSYGVYFGDFPWKFSLILPTIVSLALSINVSSRAVPSRSFVCRKSYEVKPCKIHCYKIRRRSMCALTKER